jgi:hypothetical protein
LQFIKESTSSERTTSSTRLKSPGFLFWRLYPVIGGYGCLVSVLDSFFSPAIRSLAGEHGVSPSASPAPAFAASIIPVLRQDAFPYGAALRLRMLLDLTSNRHTAVIGRRL